MAMGSGLLALAMLAAEGPSCPPDETTTFQVRVLTLDGLEWRTSSYSRLQPVTRQGTSMIWTADRALAALLTDRARSTTAYGKIMATGEAAMTRVEPVNYIASMDRYADGPINQSSAIAFMPRPDRVDERFAVKLSGRKLDQGILARIALEDTHVDVIHGVPQTESLKPTASRTNRTPAEVGRDVLNVVFSPSPNVPGQTSITSSVQIPEVTQARIEGEWMIPNDGVLLVSLGVKTAADDKGMAVVRERVAVIEACAGPNFPDARHVTAGAAQAAPFQFTKLSTPMTPARSLPEAIDPDGNIADLPPLPEALASTELDRIKPEPDQPSPQAPQLSAPEVDSALARTSYDAAPPAPKRPSESSRANVEARILQLIQELEALSQAGMSLDIENPVRDLKAPKAACEKCDGDSTFCPADARAIKPGEVAGGLKLAPEPSVQIGVSMKDHIGAPMFDTVANLNDALKNPGKTETTVIPLGGQVSLEIKATVVPTPPDKSKTATKTDEAPASKR